MTIDVIRIDEATADAFRSIRALPLELQREERRQLWARVKAQFGLPSDEKYSIQIDDPAGLSYCIIKNKATGMPIGRAKSHTPYHSVKLPELISWLQVEFEPEHPAANLPVDASPLGFNLFYKDGTLYYPVI